MDELDNEPQTLAWLLKLEADKRGIKSWQTQLVKLNSQGLPELVPDALSPCQAEQQAHIGQCKSPLATLNK